MTLPFLPHTQTTQHNLPNPSLNDKTWKFQNGRKSPSPARGGGMGCRGIQMANFHLVSKCCCSLMSVIDVFWGDSLTTSWIKETVQPHTKKNTFLFWPSWFPTLECVKHLIYILSLLHLIKDLWWGKTNAAHLLWKQWSRRSSQWLDN